MAAADERSTIDIGGRNVPVEIFKPKAGVPAPGVVVIHEIFGLNDDIRRISRRFADEGFVAAAPDLLAGGLKLVCILRAMAALQTGKGMMVDELEALIAELGARDDVGRVGAVGFCLGGGFALLLGTRQSVKAAGVYYGEIRKREELARACPLMGGYGGKDRTFAPKGRKLIRTLEELGVEHDIRMYEDAGHSFMSNAGHPVMAKLSRPL
ncbi:MAG: dienelactone hydrolase family protein, partial [Myxococcota bacterium]